MLLPIVSQPPWTFWSKSVPFLWLFNGCYLMSVCLAVNVLYLWIVHPVSFCRHGFSQSTGGERFESVISCRNKEAAVRRSPEGTVVSSPSPLRVLINTGELFWQNHWIECKSQIPGTSKWDRLSAHPQTTETLPLWGTRKSPSQGSSGFQGWQEWLAVGKRARNIE